MPITGVLAARSGARPLILLGGYGLIAMLPLLALSQTPIALGAALFVFGASLGTIDVAMNVHGAEIEAIENRSLMSNFHAQFSIGGFFGAGLVTLLLSLSIPVLACAIVGATVALASMLLARSGFLEVSGKDPEPIVVPRGVVLLLAILAAITFLIEGALLDWGALLIIDLELTEPESAGVGYILFSIAMVLARLTGDRIVERFGEYLVLLVGGSIAVLGIASILLSTNSVVAMLGFVLIGLGAANVVPILFSAAGRQNLMPPGIAIASVTTTGYAGILMGPALIGFISGASTLATAFWILALLMVSVPIFARLVAKV
ncbi:MFS transporter [Ruegeria sp. HU-ET01832]